jgi:hypothetical protein
MTQMKYLIYFCPRWSFLIETRQVIKLDPSSPMGYERKHAALRGAGHCGDAVTAFETMLSKMAQSSDPVIRGEGDDIVPKFTY